jgi:hypothetical protein
MYIVVAVADIATLLLALLNVKRRTKKRTKTPTTFLSR